MQPTERGSSSPGGGLGFPLVTELDHEFIYHDLAPDGAEVLAGSFTPTGDRVMIEVDAAYSVLGCTRAALLLYVGQPDAPGERLYDSGGKEVSGAQVHSVGSVDGESSWASTTSRRMVFDVEPGRPVTWQLLVGIIGGGDTVPVPDARKMAITPDGVRGFVTSPRTGTVTPFLLGRPGYSYLRDAEALDRALDPVSTGAGAHDVVADDEHVVVSNRDDPTAHVTILSATTYEILHQVTIDGGAPRAVALVPDGSAALVTTAHGRVVRIDLPSGDTAGVELPGAPELSGIAVTLDGAAAFVADVTNGCVHRLELPAMTVSSTTPVADGPVVVRTAADGKVWVACRPAAPTLGQLCALDPATGALTDDHELPYSGPTDLAMVPVAGQTSDIVRTAWLVYDDGNYSEINIASEFNGVPHSWHCATWGGGTDSTTGLAINDYGEIWVARAEVDLVWRWLGGRMFFRPGLFYGEYCTVSVYGAHDDAAAAT